jgi:hypothetical protein
VIENIKNERARAARKRRAAALLGLLARGWERHFAEHSTAQAVWGYDGYWYKQGEVIATWLARAASEPWLPNATGALRAPLDLPPRLGATCRELGASDVGPGVAFSGRRPEGGGSSEGEGSVNLGDSGPDSGALLSASLPEIFVSLMCEFLGLAIVIGTRHRSSKWLDVRTGVIPVAAPADALAVGDELGR